MIKRIFGIIRVGVPLLLLAGCADSQEFTALDTLCAVNYYEPVSPFVLAGVRSRVKGVESRMSAFDPGSELSQLNRLGEYPLSDDLRQVLEASLKMAEDSGGLYDPTVAPLVRLWGFGGEAASALPSADALSDALSLIDFSAVDLHDETVSLPAGMELDLGGSAKGYAAELAADYIRSSGVERAVVNLGGNVRLTGRKPDDAPWVVGVRGSPELTEYLAVLNIRGEKSVVTSGVWERFVVIGGEKRHHILDPRTGYPADNGVEAVTIVCEDGLTADLLSTACFLLGVEKGSELALKYNAHALFFLNDRSVARTPGWEKDGVSVQSIHPDYS